MIAHPDSTSEEEEDDMALNWGNKGLRELKGLKEQGVNFKRNPQVLSSSTFPPPPPLPPTDLRLHAIPNLKKKRPVQELEEGEVAPQKGTKQQKMAKDPRDKRATSVDSRRSKLGPMRAFSTALGLLGWRWMGLPSLGTPLLGSSKEVILPI